MAILKCKMCGGELEIGDSATIATCEYCGTKQTLPKATDSATQNLFNRANDLRIKCEFDRAEQTYEKILELDNSDAEAHWGLLLCRYGIEYVDDPGTGKKIPTCHRASFDPILTDSDYLAAVEMSDGEQKELYMQEAKQIGEIQKGILQIAQNEDPFDVFLCYKETGEDGKRTTDSVIANDIYYQLTQEGYKVFYAPITLEDKLGSAYEPHIFAALNSAKVMLAIGTKPAHFDAVWVKNEWSRFLALMKKDRTKLLIPCYKDMDPYDLPDRFAHLQAQDMGKIGFINDVVRGIKKVIPKEPQYVAPPVYGQPTYVPQPAYTQTPQPLAGEQAENTDELPAGHIEVFDNYTFTKVQRVLFLVSSILLWFFGSSFSFSDAWWTNKIISAVLILTPAIICFIRKKKDIFFLFSCLFMVFAATSSYAIYAFRFLFGFSQYRTSLAVYYTLFVVILFLPLIPVLSKKLRWLRFFFWIPCVLFLSFLSLSRLISALMLAIFIFAAGIPMKRNTTYVISDETLKKRNRNMTIAVSTAAVLALLILPSAWLEAAASDGFMRMEFYEQSFFTSDEKVMEMKYEAATDPSCYRGTKMEYLEELADAYYRDSRELLEEELKWRVELDYVNTTEGDCTTALGYVPRNSNYLHFGFTLHGGRAYETITVSHSIRWPGEAHKFADWDWENRGDGYDLGFEYSGGYSAMTTGDMYIDFYNKATGELITTISVPVR